jgi:hypothetical protein
MFRNLAVLAFVFALLLLMRIKQPEFVPLPTQQMPAALVP